MSAGDARSRLHAAARGYGLAGRLIIALNGKAPAIPKQNGGRGVLDATTDLAQIDAWWTAMPWANIGGRVPEGLLVVDVDPRHGGLEEDRVDELETLTAWSGRGDGGRHLYFRHPGGPISAARLPAGWDVKTSSGYTLLPPSIHPVTGRPYWWADPMVPPAELPAWLVELLRPAEQPAGPLKTHIRSSTGSIADWFNENYTWRDVLVPAGWRVCAGDGEADGSAWVHPTATSSRSATISFGCLFVYSTRTPFEPTEAGVPHGYTRFRAFATLFHYGDLSAAARAAAELRDQSR
jgi:hypothetical protein